MTYVAQGTVQVKLGSKSKLLILINPSSDYRVRHKATKENKAREYVILVEATKGTKDSPKSCAFPVEITYEVNNDSLKDALKQAAFEGTKIEVEFYVKGKKAKIVGLQIPATGRNSDATEH